MALDTNFPSLRFPEDLGTVEVPNYIRFTPQEFVFGGTTGLNPISRPNNSLPGVGTTLSGIGSAVNSNNPFRQVQNQIGGAVDSFSNGARQAVGAVGDIFNAGSLSQSFTNLGKVVSGSVNVGPFTLNLGQQTAPDELRTLGSINLFLPESLVTSSSVDYSATELRGIGAEIAKGAGEQREGNLDIGSLGQQGVKALIADFTRSSQNLSAINAVSRGEVANNFSYQIFNGVGHRAFGYTFRMVAKSEAESKTIKDICDTFLYYMLPARKNNASGGDGLHFYEIPAQFKIEYKRMGATLQYHQQPKACFLTQVEVNYGGDSRNATYSDGAPMEVTLTLRFVEIEPLYRENTEAKIEAARTEAFSSQINQTENDEPLTL